MQNYYSFQFPEIASQYSSNAGSWSFQENLNYAIYIDIHKKSMTSKKKMRYFNFNKGKYNFMTNYHYL